MGPFVMTEEDMKEEEKQEEASNEQNQLEPSQPDQNFSVVIIPPRNEVIEVAGKTYFFVDTSGSNPVSPILKVPIPIGKVPTIQGTSTGFQFLMLNSDLASSPVSNPDVTEDEKGSAIKSEKGVQLPVIGVDDEVIYVNPKQYKRILVRRMQRCKLQAQGKIPNAGDRERKKYLHESRHLHAKNRCRESGGRFSRSPTQD